MRPLDARLGLLTGLAFVALTLCLSCAPSPRCSGYASYLSNVHGYDIRPDVEIDGIDADAAPGVDLARLSSIVDSIEACLLAIGDLPRPEAVNAWCLHQEYHAEPLRRECLAIKIVTDWVWSCDGRYQLLRDRAPGYRCRQKGFENDPVCPCRWRAAVQDGCVIVVPPQMSLLGEPLVRIATGCDYPYSSPNLARCANLSAEVSP